MYIAGAMWQFGGQTQLYVNCLYYLVKRSTVSIWRCGILYRSCMLTHEPLAAELRAAPTLAMTLKLPETSVPSLLTDRCISSRNCGRWVRVTKSSKRV